MSSSSAPPKVTLSTATKNPEIRAYLEKLAQIRIVVNGGRGLGHQAAGVTAMNRLRELGFAGHFDVVFPSSYVEDNLAVLMPEVKSEEKAAQNKVSFQELEEEEGSDCYHLDFAPLVITGADDERANIKGTANARYNGGTYIGLQPTDWNSSRWVESLADDHVHPLDGRAALFCEALPTIAKNEIEDTDLAELLNKLFEKNKNFEFQSIYGLYSPTAENPFTGETVRLDTSIEPLEELKALLMGLKQAQSNFLKKPVVVLVHSEVDQQVYRELTKFMKKQQRPGQVVVAHDFEQACSHIDALGTDDILICKAENLPKNIFERLLLENTLPPVVEGCNTLAFLEANRSFLHGGAPKNTIDQIPDEFFSQHKIDPALQKFHMKACEALEKGRYDDATSAIVAQFMMACKSGEMNAYFTARQAYFRSREDILGSALLQAAKMPLYTDENKIISAYSESIFKVLGRSPVNLEKMALFFDRFSALLSPEKLQSSPSLAKLFHVIGKACVDACVDAGDKNKSLAERINGKLPAADQRSIDALFKARASAASVAVLGLFGQHHKSHETPASPAPDVPKGPSSSKGV